MYCKTKTRAIRFALCTSVRVNLFERSETANAAKTSLASDKLVFPFLCAAAACALPTPLSHQFVDRVLETSSALYSSQVQWLMEHFENAEGVSLPRALMYNHYMLHCQEQSLDPVNAASFGKLVRSVFLGLRTRRLGTRWVAGNAPHPPPRHTWNATARSEDAASFEIFHQCCLTSLWMV